MKRYMFVLIGLNVLALFCVLLREIPLKAANQGAAIAGDVNGDGRLDIGDPVYLLTFLFLPGGEPPVACAVEPDDVAERVEALEQNLTDLMGSLNEKLDLLVEALDPCDERAERFVDNGDRTVTDTCRQLMWQQGEHRFRSFKDATTLARSFNLGGHTDWRLPTADELRSLVLWKDATPVIPPIFGFWEERDVTFWTATSVAGSNPNRVLVVNFDQSVTPGFDSHSYSVTEVDTIRYFVMLVRDIGA